MPRGLRLHLPPVQRPQRETFTKSKLFLSIPSGHNMISALNQGVDIVRAIPIILLKVPLAHESFG